ncbi:MAG: hypothetical protein M1820_000424 [Bogoriella megaspora]|nr:MAG: hypothetical protein M1820_000424 [Bogoriella megaspora]
MAFTARSSTSSRRANLLATALTVLSVLPFASTQQLLQFGNGQLPECAQGCTLLSQAQAACVPPAAPATGQQQYQSCFCQSAYLRTLYQSPNGVCDASCGQSDLVSIQKWYTGLCSGTVGAAQGTSSSSSASSTSATASSTAPVATVSPTSTSSSSTSSSSAANKNANKSWISTHYGWVIFLIVLVAAIAFFTFGGIWLKRRFKARRAATRGFNSTVTTSQMPGSSAGMRSVDWAPGLAKAQNASSVRVGTPMGMAGANGMRSTESGVESTGSGSNGKGKANANTLAEEDVEDQAGTGRTMTR